MRSITEIDIFWPVLEVGVGKTVGELVGLFVGASVDKVFGKFMGET